MKKGRSKFYQFGEEKHSLLYQFGCTLSYIGMLSMITMSFFTTTATNKFSFTFNITWGVFTILAFVIGAIAIFIACMKNIPRKD